VVSEVDGIIK